MAVPPQRVDIVPSRLMAAPAEFDSYQLDSKHFPIITSTLREERSVCEPQTHDTQFSMQHLLTAASAEQLIWDPYQTTAEIHTFYTVTKDKTGETFFSLWSFNVRTRKWIQQDHNICSWPAPTDGRPAYPCSCKVTQRFVIVNTGVDKLLIFDKAGSNGKDVAAIRTISAVLEPGVIADARWDSQIGHLNVLLQDVEEINREGQNTVYGSRLTWLTILPTDNAPDDRNQPQPEEFIHEKLRPVRKRVILVEGNMEMATFSTANEIVVVASSKPYMVLVLDSVDLHTDDTVIGRRILHAKRKRGIKANIADDEPMEEYKEPEMSD
ncbi:hypothetical protein L596_016354 [Steinernema carpocapsae]|uniref:Uncharacterized protein n=1 Tax=Steinernema carpocapsae TaxID=34508 RepID=A0A4V6XW97_STECR|nr:hypothetical protein L596_016354 [Steinernema carpocapsae]